MRIAIEEHVKRRGEATRERTARLTPDEAEVFGTWLRVLERSGVAYVVAGAFALHEYAGIWRDTKDLDVLVTPEDLKTALDALEAAGFQTEVLDPTWLAKARRDPFHLDLIFSLGHASMVVDPSWIASGRRTDILGVRAPVAGLEELIVTKCHVNRSDRFDGADIAHLIRASAGIMDWGRILELLREDWELLLWQLIFFDYVYPGHSGCLPRDLMDELFSRLRARWEHCEATRHFNGMSVDPLRFAVDVEDWGYLDERPARPLVNAKGERA